jgi:hypothetical protein
VAEQLPADSRSRSLPAKGFARDNTVHADPVPATAPPDALLGTPESPSDIATGRTTRYEWELFVSDVLTRVETLESTAPSSGTGVTYRHTQSSAAATWTISHGLGTKPSLTVVDNAGNAAWVEAQYPDDNTTVLVFCLPVAGYAYLRG